MTRHMLRGAALALGFAILIFTQAVGAVELPSADKQAFWTPAEKLVGFRSMARLYGGGVVHHGGRVMPLPKSAHELEVRFAVAGRTFDVPGFMEHNRVAGLMVLHRGT